MAVLPDLVRRAQLLGRHEELVLAHAGEALDARVDRADVAHRLDDVTGAGLALGAHHGRALVDAAQGLTQVAVLRGSNNIHAPPRLRAGATYYWRVDEVNEARAVPLWEGVENAVIAGQVVAASADEDVLYGDGVSKLAAMRTPYITNRSVDAASWTATGPQLCGLVGGMANFWEMT